MLTLVVFAPHAAAPHEGPTGFLFTQELFRAFRLQPEEDHALLTGLARRLRYLRNRYPGRIRIQWVEPWSVGGLWLVWRFRIRTFPTIIIGGHEIIPPEKLDHLEDRVAEILSNYLSEKS